MLNLKIGPNLLQNQIQFSCLQTKKTIKRKKIGQSRDQQQESYQPAFNEAKKIGITLDQNKLARGGWSLQQNKIYLKFLIHHKYDFQSPLPKLRKKMFNQLSKILIKRTPDQCRSHHQKLHKKCDGNFDKILQYIQKKIELKTQRSDQQLLNKSSKQFKITSIKTSIYQDKYEDQQSGIFIIIDQLALW